MRFWNTLLVPAAFVALLGGSALATDLSQEATQDLAKATQNPVADLISLPLQNNTSFRYGPERGTLNILNIQPVIPISLGESWNLITRTILPIVTQPALAPSGNRVSGLGDTTFTAFLSPRNASGLVWGAGPVLLIPTSTNDRLGTGEWGLGPSAVILTMPGNWVLGSLFSNVWSFGSGTVRIDTPPGDGLSFDRKVNLFTWQYFVNYNLPDGWYLSSAPIMSANWEASSGNRWTVPIGGGGGKVFRLGSQPMNAQVQAFYNVEKPRFGADWSLRFQLQFLFPR